MSNKLLKYKASALSVAPMMDWNDGL